MNGVFGFDIQYTICTEGNLDRRDFCRLALTSRSWREAATPKIWVQPDAITPLLRLMPQDAWYMARNRPNDPKAYFVLRRPLTPADWEPVYARSRFVKDMRVHDTELEDLHELCTFIAPCPPPRVLLSRLETLEAYTTKRQSQFSADQSLLPLFSILLYPSPYLLHFQDVGSKIVRHLNMRSLASLCPHITWIEVNTWAELTPTLRSQWAEAIKKWDGMTSISLDPCFPEILLSIAPGPALSYPSLHFRHVQASEATNRMPTLPSSCFPSLDHLGLRGLSFFEMTSAIRSWDMRQLVSVDLGSPDRPLSSDELQYLTDSIRDYCTNHALYRVAIFYNAASLGALEFPLTKEHLLPLAGFTHLKYLCLQVSLSVFLTDAEYAELLPCWPHLEHFEVNGGLLSVDEWDEESPATLVALQHFARYCPMLEELYLPLTVDEVPESDVETFGNDHPLWKLHLGCSAISASADATATFLSFLFPNLTSAAFDWYTNKWHEVFRLVTAYCYGG